MTKKIRTCLYFGSFNPVHIGHTVIAGYLTEYTDIDEVWFVVSPHNPLKKKETLLPGRDRLYMTSLAIANHYNFRTCDIELTLPQPSYTIDTLAYLREKHPGNDFALTMGEDNLYTLHKWKNAAELVKLYPIYVYPRKEAFKPPHPLLEEILKKADIRFVKAPLIEISGTFIRKGIRAGKNMSYYLHPAVWKYIQEMNFYKK
ncbi:MAG TPA: nicotinate (nicotinamide) nucleotide adenylyltransferase [Bacteroidales bacterium]|nr:nicotinate (nicotinamide) nucleotide adenylyltransferase [Bacteroidales bacterium]